MTWEEAKDYAVIERGWAEKTFKEYRCSFGCSTGNMEEILTRASELYSDSVREKAYRDGFGQGVHEGNERALETCLQDYLKLTAPGH